MGTDLRLGRRDLVRLAVLGVLPPALVACTPVARSTDLTATTDAGPRRGGSLTVGHPQDMLPRTVFGSSYTGNHLGALVFDTLIRYGPDRQPVPHLAQSWEVSADRRSVTVRLRDDVFFHDDTPLTAQDVVATVTALKDPTLAYNLAGLVSRIDRVRAGAGLDVTFELARPTSQFFDLLCGLPIAAAATLPGVADGTQVVGTGPFVWDTWRPGDRLTLVRNERYWRPGLPYLDEVVIAKSDAPAIVNGLLAGSVHVVNSVTAADVRTFEGAEAVVVEPSGTNGQGFYLGCTVTRAPVDDRALRQALAWAVDRDRVVRDVFGGSATPSCLPFAPGSPAYDEALAQHYATDPDRARDLATRAGYRGESLGLAFKSDAPQFVQLAQIVQSDLARAGFRVDLVPMDTGAFQDALQNAAMPHLWLNGHAFPGLDPATLTSTAFAFRADKNSSNFSDPGYTALVDEASTLPIGSPERATALRRLAEVIVEEQFTIELCIEEQLSAHHRGVQGVAHSLYGPLLLEQAWVSG